MAEYRKKRSPSTPGVRVAPFLDPEEIATVRPGVDIVRLPLSAEEGFVLSRVDGHTSVRELVLATGLPESMVQAALVKLLELRAISLSGEAPPADAEADDEGELVDPVLVVEEEEDLTDAERAESVDLTEEQRRRIKVMVGQCGRADYYALLGVDRKAAVADIKRAWLEKSREFHPDAYFRKRLGSFKAHMETVFKHLKTAYDVLSDADARRRYDETFKGQTDAQDPGRVEALRAWAQDPRRQKELEERRRRRNPMVQRIAKAQRHFKQAQDEKAAGKLAAAANEIALAMAHDPMDPGIRELNEAIQKEMRAQKAVRMVAMAENMVLTGNVPEGTSLPDLARQALELESLNAIVYVRLGKLLYDHQHYQQARDAAERALKLDPNNTRALELLVEVYERVGMNLNAARALDKLVRLQPTAERQERLKRLRAGV